MKPLILFATLLRAPGSCVAAAAASRRVAKRIRGFMADRKSVV